MKRHIHIRQLGRFLLENLKRALRILQRLDKRRVRKAEPTERVGSRVVNGVSHYRANRGTEPVADVDVGAVFERERLKGRTACAFYRFALATVKRKERDGGKELTRLDRRQPCRLFDKAIQQRQTRSLAFEIRILRLALCTKGGNVFRVEAQVVDGESDGCGDGVDRAEPDGH